MHNTGLRRFDGAGQAVRGVPCVRTVAVVARLGSVARVGCGVGRAGADIPAAKSDLRVAGQDGGDKGIETRRGIDPVHGGRGAGGPHLAGQAPHGTGAGQRIAGAVPVAPQQKDSRVRQRRNQAVRLSDAERDALIEPNMGLVFSTASRMGRTYPFLDFDEVVSECQIAFLRAATTYRADSGFRFSTYAVTAMVRAVYRIAKPKRKAQVFQLDEVRGVTGLHSQAHVYFGVTPRELYAAMDTLPDTSQYVLCLRFGLDGDETMTLEAIGALLQVSKERVRQIQNKALAALKVAVQEYL